LPELSVSCFCESAISSVSDSMKPGMALTSSTKRACHSMCHGESSKSTPGSQPTSFPEKVRMRISPSHTPVSSSTTGPTDVSQYGEAKPPSWTIALVMTLRRWRRIDHLS
jgi:hypothetical protein